MLSKLFKRNAFEIYSPVNGIIYPIEEVEDPIFSSKAAGDGIGIKHSLEKYIYSPIDGVIEVIAHTKHAIYISNDSLELLIHVGIDTVKLNGEFFNLKVNKKEKIKKGQILMEVDFNSIKEKGINTDIILTFNKKIQNVYYGEINKFQKILEIREK